MNEKVRVGYSVLVLVLLVAILATGIRILGSGRDAQKDISAIRDEYRRLEESYRGVRDSVDGLGKQLPSLAQGLERIEGRTVELGKSIQSAQVASRRVSDAVGRLEETNRDFAEFLAGIGVELAGPGLDPK